MSSAAPNRLRLSRTSRIKQSRDFARAKTEGQRAVCGCLIANWRRLTDAANSRVGVVVSKKVGGSVARSRARRLLREVFRVHQHELAQSLDLVLVARASIAERSFGEVEKDFLTVMGKAGLLNAERGARNA